MNALDYVGHCLEWEVCASRGLPGGLWVPVGGPLVMLALQKRRTQRPELSQHFECSWLCGALLGMRGLRFVQALGGPSGTLVEAFGSPLGAHGCPFGALGGLSGPLWGALGALCGPFWGPLGLLWAPFGSILH